MLLTQENASISNAFSWNAALQYGVLVVTLLTGLLVLSRAFNKRIDKAAKQAVAATQAVQAEVKTGNGHTAGELIEQIPSALNELREIGTANRDLAQAALRLSIQNRDDLLEHKTRDHNGQWTLGVERGHRH